MTDNHPPDDENSLIDDGWWESVLAEDVDRSEPANSRYGKVEEPSRPVSDWDRAMSLYLQDGIINLKVTGYNRGGLLVEGEGLNGFVPYSHLVKIPVQPPEDSREACLATYINQSLRLKVIECVPEEGRLVFSERAGQVEAGRRPTLLNSIQTGQRVKGIITNVTNFGVFVDLGGVEGLIHISELSWGRVTCPGQVCKVGQLVEVQVMDVAPERCRIALSLKRLFPNPWEAAEERYKVDAIVPAVISTLTPFGAFARLEEGLEGLIHNSEIPVPNDKVVKDILQPGQMVQVRILHVEASRQRLGLSLKVN
jgi:small subunit ribosomal protein S1